MNTKDETCLNTISSSIVENWVRENIYDYRKGDGAASNVKCRFDWMLLVYFFSVAVSFADIIACFSKEMTLQNCVGKSGD